MKHYSLSLLPLLLCGLILLPHSTLCQDTIAPMVQCQSKTFDIQGEYRCIDPKDLTLNYSDNQDKKEDLKVSFSQLNNKNSWCISCDTFYWYGASKIIRDVKIEVSDLSGNISTCTTRFTITDSSNYCGHFEHIVEGSVINPLTQDALPDIEVNIKTLQRQHKYVTNKEGYYHGIYDHRKTGVIHAQALNPRNLVGVSTKDVIAIYRHLLGIKDFNSGIQLIAADVNNDKNISIQDVTALKKIMRGLHADFSKYRGQKSWRLILADKTIQSNMHPWPLTESDTIRFGGDFKGNFYGIKIGDVTGDAIIYELNNTNSRSDQSIRLRLNHLEGEKALRATCDIQFDDNIQLAGFQLMLRVKGVEKIHQLKSDLIDIENDYSIYEDDGDFIIKLLWHDQKGLSRIFEKGSTLFKVKYEPKNDPRTGLQIQNLDGNLHSEAYDVELDEYDITWENQSESLSLLPAELNLSPNPWSHNTTVSFEANSTGIGHISIYNLEGKTCFKKQISIKRGQNQVHFYRSIVNQPGIYMVKLSVLGDHLFSRMIHL